MSNTHFFLIFSTYAPAASPNSHKDRVSAQDSIKLHRSLRGNECVSTLSPVKGRVQPWLCWPRSCPVTGNSGI